MNTTTESKIYTRQKASELTRELLTDNGLQDWHVRLTTDITKPFLGLCSYKDNCIILNAHHIDTHPDIEVLNTIRHEVAHALTPGHNHDEIWASKARELGCDNTMPCVAYSLSVDAIDAIRSGAELVVSYTEETQVIRKPKYEVRKLQDKCHVCGKVIKDARMREIVIKESRYKKYEYECGHYLIKLAESQTLFENFITAEHRNNGCAHEWDKNKCLKCNAFKPFPFQVEGMRSLERANGRLAIFDEMGLGKTIQALGYINFHKEALPVLYVVKSGIKYQWMSQILIWLGDKYLPQVLSSSKENFLPGLKSYIVSYDILRRLTSEQLDSLIEKIGIKTVVLDECQQIKNPDSSRTQLVRMLVKKVQNVIPLSGTPWKNRGSEFFVVLNMLDPKRFWSYEGFKKQWVDYYYDGNKMKEGGILYPAKFKEYIKDLAIRRERTEVMPELPVISRNKYLTEVPENLRKVYAGYEKDIQDIYNNAVLEGRESSFEVKAALNKNLMIMRQIVGIAKIPGTLEFTQEFLEETDRKLAVFVHHKECGTRIFEEMSKWCAANNEPQPLKLTADLSGAERFNVQEQFNGPNYRLLIASTLASGEGLNLQSCSDCVMHERQWNPGNEEQAEGRFIRIGQTANAVNATYVHADETCDIDLDGIVERKRVAFHNTMNKGQLPVWNESDIQDQIVQSIIKKGRRK